MAWTAPDEPTDGIGFTAQLSEETTEQLSQIRRSIGAPTLSQTLAVVVRELFNSKEFKRNLIEERPLAQFGQGDYITEIREEDC